MPSSTDPQPASEPRDITAMPAVVLSGADALWSDGSGETRKLQADETLRRLAETPHLVCHAAFLVNRLRLGAAGSDRLAKAAAECAHLDLAELYAFVHPARFALPTPSGLERALGLRAGSSRSGAPDRACAEHGEQSRLERLSRAPGGGDHCHAPVLRALALGAPCHRRPRDRRHEHRRLARRHRPQHLGPAAGMGGPRAETAAGELAGHPRRGRRPAREAGRRGRRGPAHPARLLRRRRADLRRQGRARRQHGRAGGGGHRPRQDARLSGAGRHLVRPERRHGVDLDLHQEPSAPTGAGNGAALPRRRGTPAPRGRAQGAGRTTSAS